MSRTIEFPVKVRVDNMYFLIRNRRTAIGKSTTITVALKEEAKIGDKLNVENLKTTVLEITDQKERSDGRIFQKLKIEVGRRLTAEEMRKLSIKNDKN